MESSGNRGLLGAVAREMRRSLGAFALRAGLALGIYLTVIPFVIRFVGAPRFGLFAAAAVLASANFQLDFGLSTALSRAAALELAAGRAGTARRFALVGSGLLVLIWSGLMAVVGLVFHTKVDALAGSVAMSDFERGASLALVVISSLVGVLATAPQACLTGVKRFELVSADVAVSQLVLWPLALTFVAAGAGLPGLLGAQLCVNALLCTLLWRHLMQVTAGQPAGPAPVAQLKDALKLLPSRLHALVMNGSARWVLASLGLLPELAAYEVAAKLTEGLRLAGYYWTMPVLASASTLAAAAPEESAAHTVALLARANRPLWGFFLPVCACVALAAPALCLAWLGRPDPLMSHALTWLAIGYAAQIVQLPLFLVLVGRGCFRSVAISSMAGTLLHPILGYLLGVQFGFGGVLAVFATVEWTLTVYLLGRFHWLYGGWTSGRQYAAGLAQAALVAALFALTASLVPELAGRAAGLAGLVHAGIAFLPALAVFLLVRPRAMPDYTEN